MYEELVKCADLMIQFGGHPMAAGLSIEEKNRFVREPIKFEKNCVVIRWICAQLLMDVPDGAVKTAGSVPSRAITIPEQKNMM